MGTADVNYLQINTTLTMGLQQRAFPKDIRTPTNRKINTFFDESLIMKG